jgi:hypothetical protein
MATITTLKSGDYTDTLVWSTGTVPVDGDKVTISKLGTATSRTTSSSISAGATNVPVTAGTGTGLIGEVIEFDSRPGEYYELTTGFTASAGTAVVTPALAGAIASGATLRNRGHKVKLLGTRVAGDDTTTGFTVNGVLYWDRASAASLQVKGTYTVSATGTEDRGTAVDPLTAVTATLLCNYSAALAVNKYTYTKTAGGRIKHYGLNRTRKTTLTASAIVGATSLTVAAAANWAVGDSIIILPTIANDNSNSFEQRTINSVAGTTIGISAGLTYAKASGAFVLNVSSNIVTAPFDATRGYNTTISSSSASLARDFDVFHSQFLAGTNNGSQAWALSGSSGASDANAVYADSSVFRATTSTSAVVLSGTVKAPILTNCIALDDGAAAGIQSGAAASFTNGAALSTHASGKANISGASPIAFGTMNGNLLAGISVFTTNVSLIGSTGSFIGNTILTGSSFGTHWSIVAPGMTIESNIVDPFNMQTSAAWGITPTSARNSIKGTRFVQEPTWVFGTYPNCRITSTFSTGRTTSRTHEIWDDVGYAYADTSTRNRGDAALNVSNRTTSPFVYTFTAAIANGATKRLVAYLRRNATYGAGSMPQITLSIPGVTSVSSSVTDAADTWFPADLSITNTTGSTQEVTVTMSANGAANSASSAWFDGVPIYPFVQAVRHYGFVFDESNPFRVVNPVTVANEATAAAYTGVAVNTSTPSITVGAGTTDTWQKLYDGHQAWGVANLTQTVLLTSTDGQTFNLPLACKLSWPAMPGDKTLSGGWLLLATPGLLNYRLSGTKIEFQTAGTYNMSGTTFSGTVELVNTSGGSVTVNVPSGTSYTNTGPNITVATPSVTQSVTINGLVSGSRVQVYDTTNSVELANGTSTTSFSWTDSSPASGSRDIRVRIAYVSGVSAKEFIEANIGTCGTTSGTEALTYLASQIDDSVYIANNIDGSTVTGITISDGIDRMVINIAGGSVSWPQIYAYNVYWLSTSTGIQDDGAIMTAVDTANYLVTGFMIRNTNSVALSITGGYGRDSATGTVASLIDTAGSTGNIYQTPDHVVAYATGSGLSPAESAKLMGLPDAADVWVEPKALTVGKFLALK